MKSKEKAQGAENAVEASPQTALSCSGVGLELHSHWRFTAENWGRRWLPERSAAYSSDSSEAAAGCNDKIGTCTIDT